LNRRDFTFATYGGEHEALNAGMDYYEANKYRMGYEDCKEGGDLSFDEGDTSRDDVPFSYSTSQTCSPQFTAMPDLLPPLPVDLREKSPTVEARRASSTTSAGSKYASSESKNKSSSQDRLLELLDVASSNGQPSIAARNHVHSHRKSSSQGGLLDADAKYGSHSRLLELADLWEGGKEIDDRGTGHAQHRAKNMNTQRDYDKVTHANGINTKNDDKEEKRDTKKDSKRSSRARMFGDDGASFDTKRLHHDRIHNDFNEAQEARLLELADLLDGEEEGGRGMRISDLLN
jgi:hypothetical protein